MNSKSYLSYSLSFKEYLLYGIVYYSVCALFSYVFYDSVSALWIVIFPDGAKFCDYGRSEGIQNQYLDSEFCILKNSSDGCSHCVETASDYCLYH